MGLASAVETINLICNCFLPNKQKTYDDIQEHYNHDGDDDIIHILPTNEQFKLKNLYPSTNKTEKWSVLCVGSDLTYIKVCLGDFNLKGMDFLTNKKGGNVISKRLNDTLEPIWNATLKGNRLQFFLLVNGLTYLVNSFPLDNTDGSVIGAVMFIRAYTTEKRDSEEKRRSNDLYEFNRNGVAEKH